MLSRLSCVQLFVTLWTVAHQAPLSMGFFWQEYWTGLLCPLSGDLPDAGIEPVSPALQAGYLPSEPPRASQVVLVVKNLSANTDLRDMGLIPGSGRSPRGGNGTPLQYSCQKNPMDRGAWWAAIHGVTKSRTQLSTEHCCYYCCCCCYCYIVLLCLFFS